MVWLRSIALSVIRACATRDLDTHDDFVSFLHAAGQRPAVVYFYTKTCGPCKIISPVFDEVAAAHEGHAFFAKVDARDNEDTPELQDVVSLPTIQFYLGSEVVHQISKDTHELSDWTKEFLAGLIDDTASAGNAASGSSISDPISTVDATGDALQVGLCEERRRNSNHVEDVVVVGGGPAGLSAAIYAARGGHCPLIVSPGVTRRAALTDFPGVDGGSNVMAVMRQQAHSFSAQFVKDTVSTIKTLHGGEHEIVTASGTHIKARAVIVATGVATKRLQTPGARDTYGKGLSNCAACDAHLVKGAPCAVIGDGDSAVEEALRLSRVCSSVALLAKGPELKVKSALKERLRRTAGVSVKLNHEVVRFLGQRRRLGGRHVLKLEHIEVRDPRRLRGREESSLIPVAGAFVATDQQPSTSFLRGCVDLDSAGFVNVNGASTAASVPGIFAAGSVTSTGAAYAKAAVASARHGSIAALDAERFLAQLVVPKEPPCPSRSAAKALRAS